MKVLVACEYSGRVRDAFRAAGHDAWSCDLLPCDADPEWHIQGDVVPLLGQGWDLMVAHPPCTYLCSSGLHWNKRVPGRQAKTEQALDFVRTLLSCPIPQVAIENPVGCISTRIRKPDQTIQPWQFGHDASKATCLWLKNLPLLKAESSNVIAPKGYQLVRGSWEMSECVDCGEPFCDLHQNHYADCGCIGPTEDEVEYLDIAGFSFATRQSPAPRPVWANQTPSGQNKLGPSPDRWKIRSETYQGIATAFAQQWGIL